MNRRLAPVPRTPSCRRSDDHTIIAAPEFESNASSSNSSAGYIINHKSISKLMTALSFGSGAAPGYMAPPPTPTPPAPANDSKIAAHHHHHHHHHHAANTSNPIPSSDCSNYIRSDNDQEEKLVLDSAAREISAAAIGITQTDRDHDHRQHSCNILTENISTDMMAAVSLQGAKMMIRSPTDLDDALSRLQSLDLQRRASHEADAIHFASVGDQHYHDHSYADDDLIVDSEVHDDHQAKQYKTSNRSMEQFGTSILQSNLMVDTGAV